MHVQKVRQLCQFSGSSGCNDRVHWFTSFACPHQKLRLRAGGVSQFINRVIFGRLAQLSKRRSGVVSNTATLSRCKDSKKNRNINNNFVAFVFCGLTFHVFSQTRSCVVDWLGSYFVRFGSFGARRRSFADEPRSFSGEPRSYKSRREIYISRREMYIISAGNVHLPPRFITSWAAPKVCGLCGKTSRASASVY